LENRVLRRYTLVFRQELEVGGNFGYLATPSITTQLLVHLGDLT